MIRFGLIGTSAITESFIEAGREHPEFYVSAVYSRSVEKGQQFATQNHIDRVFTNLEEMAESGEIDAMYIASPNAFHCDQALFFLDRKIPVLVEKPIALNAKEVEKMIAASKDSNTLLMTGLRNMYEPRMQEVSKILHKIGPIRRIYATYCQYSSRYDALKAGTVENAFQPAMGGGAAMDLGIYVVGPTVHQFGMPKSLSVSGQKLDSGVDGQGVMVLNYDNMDAVLSFSKTFMTRREAEICGEEGCIYLKTTPEDPIIIEYRNGKKEEVYYEQKHRSMFYEIEEFIRCFKNNNKESPFWTGQDDLKAQKLIDAYRSQVGVVYPGEQ